MPELNIFSKLIREGSNVSLFRKVRHSASNFVRGKRAPSGLNRKQRAVNAVRPANVAFGSTRAAASVMKHMSGAAAGTGFVVAILGPQATVTAAAITLALLAKSMYSNREAAHRGLIDYVWNMVDDKGPRTPLTEESLRKAGQAALTLLKDGQNQVAIMGKKHATAEKKFNVLQKEIEEIASNFYASKQSRDAENNQAIYENGVAIGSKTSFLYQIHQEQMDRYRSQLSSIWTKETKPGRIIHQYVRRCVHTGNYLQAPYVLHLAMLEASSPGSVINNTNLMGDPFLGNTLCIQSRAHFKKLDKFYTDLNAY